MCLSLSKWLYGRFGWKILRQKLSNCCAVKAAKTSKSIRLWSLRSRVCELLLQKSTKHGKQFEEATRVTNCTLSAQSLWRQIRVFGWIPSFLHLQQALSPAWRNSILIERSSPLRTNSRLQMKRPQSLNCCVVTVLLLRDYYLFVCYVTSRAMSNISGCPGFCNCFRWFLII